MKLFVTGALGHIGSRMIRELPERIAGLSITMVDNMSTQRYCSLFNLPKEVEYRFIEDDILSMDLFKEISRVDAVLHFAAITDAAGSFENRSKVESVNFGATKKVADACSQAKIPMIHFSSTSVYGTQNSLVDEDCKPDELQPQSPYAETKLAEESYLQQVGRDLGLDYIICRLGTICGESPGMRFHTAVNKFCWQAVLGQPLTVWRTALHQKRPYLDLQDAVSAVAHILDTKLFDRRIYNVLTENLTVNEIIEFIKEHIADISITFVDNKIMNQLSYEVSNHRFKVSGFNFTGSIRKAIADTIRVLRASNGKRGEIVP